MTVDFLIIGQGLAGSLLAWELIQRNCNVMIIDNGKENASQIAAGLINPVTGSRFVKSAEVDSLLPAAKRCYSQLANFFQRDFFIEKPMLRLFRSSQELKNGLSRLDNPDYKNYLGALHPPEKSLAPLKTPFGYLQQKQTGYLLTRPLLSCLKEFFIARDCYKIADFDYRDIQLQPVLRWQSISPRYIIFCEGYKATGNPWFSWLPFQPVKGEILTLEHQLELPDNILNYGNWLIPVNPRHIRIGATFEREHLNTLPTETGREALLTALKPVLPGLMQTRLLGHEANIRPCTMDRQPFIGSHPHYKQLIIFNGFGAKGGLQIPWYSRKLVDSLINNTSRAFNIQRHYATHFAG
jgi:glycine/D-amino acid oxidase-like deaminating enzyme